MATATRRGILAVVAAVVLLAVGAAVGIALGMRMTDDPVAGEFFADTSLSAQRAERDPAMAWIARALLVLAVLWLVIGMVASRTRLVRRPGAGAARAAWLSATRPWRARESTLGMLPPDRLLLIGIPAGLLVGTRAVQTSFLSWTHLVLTLCAWLAFAIVVRVLVGRRSPWPVIAAVGGVIVLRCILTLLAVGLAGPGAFAAAFWTDPVVAAVYTAVALAVFVWLFVAAGWALSTQWGSRRATGIVLAGAGAGLAVPATIVGIVGLEQASVIWTDEPVLLPWGLVQLVGGVDRLELPAHTGWLAAGVGLVIAIVGALLAIPRSRAQTPPITR